MPTAQEARDAIRKLNRNAELVVHRSGQPLPGEDYFVQKLGSPDGGTNGLKIVDLQIKCSIERDLSRHPNRCKIEIINVSEKTRHAMETTPLFIDFSAGHAGINKLLMSGDVLFAMSKHDGVDWTTMLQVGDGARAHAEARVALTLKRGTTVKTALREVAKKLGQKLPSNIEASSDLNVQFACSTVIHGSASHELTRMLAPYGLDWSVQNGRLQILKYAESRNDVQLISEANGMINTPQYGQPSKTGKVPPMTIQNLLYPELTPGGLVEVRSKSTNGLFKLIKVRHNLDTHGDPWFTEVEVKPATGAPSSALQGKSAGVSR